MSWFINDSLSFKNIAILNAKSATFRRILIGISKTEGLKRLNKGLL